jgi:hypothetical protein
MAQLVSRDQTALQLRRGAEWDPAQTEPHRCLEKLRQKLGKKIKAKIGIVQPVFLLRTIQASA